MVAGILPLYFGVGLVFGSIDLTAVSVATFVGQSPAAGLILAVFALGSVAAGLLFGPLSAPWPAARRILVTALAYGSGLSEPRNQWA